MAERKTHTSTAVKQRYNEKTYDRIVLNVRKDVAAQYREKCEAAGIPYSQPLHEAVQRFINDNH